MQSSRRPDRRAPVPGQGRDPVRSGGRHRRRGRGLAARGLRQDHRLRHGRHVDRRHALGRRVRARVRDRSRRRAPARADDAHPHGRRRRRLDLHVRRRALSRRPRVRRRESRPGVVPARRPARGHRLQRDGRQARSRAVPEGVRAATATRRSTPTSCARSSQRSPARSRRRPASSERPRQIADGFLKIAVENMANAIKHISVARGYDVTEYTLCCFGGAGGQHACAVADALGMTRVFIHPLAGVLSAYGMGLADVRSLRQQAVETRSRREHARAARAGVRRARGGGARRGAPAGHRRRRASRAARTLHLKYEGTDTTLEVAAGDDPARDRRGVRAALPAAIRLPDAGTRARRRGDRRRGDGPRRSRSTDERPTFAPRVRRAARAADRTASTRTAHSTTRPSTRARTCGRATASTARRSCASAMRRR